VKKRNVRSKVCTLFLMGMIWCSHPLDADAMNLRFGIHPDKERLVFTFPNSVPQHTLKRTGRNELQLVAPQGLGPYTGKRPRFGNSKLVRAVNVSNKSAGIRLGTDAFGYVSFTLKSPSRLVVDVFRDPLGARWKKAKDQGAKSSAAAVKKTPAAQAQKHRAKKSSESVKKPAAQKKRTHYEVPNVFRGELGKKGGVSPTKKEIASQAVAASTAQNPDAQPQVKAEKTAPQKKAAMPKELSQKPWSFRGSIDKADGKKNAKEARAERLSQTRPASKDLPQPLVDAPEPESLKKAEKALAAGPDFGKLMNAAIIAQNGKQYDAALEQLGHIISDKRAPKDMREEALYMKGDVLYAKYGDDLAGHFDEVNGAYEIAMNANLDSSRVPAALLKRGVLNLRVDNVPEAKAFFKILRDKYKNDPNVPLTYYYWGDYHFKNKDYERAADEFQYLVQVYPDCTFVREASLGLARSLKELGYDEQAYKIVDFIEKRWPRFYIEFPPFLQLEGDAAYAVKDYEAAKDFYWAYYNIDPRGDDADIILARIGDAYVNMDRFDAAREIYEKAVSDFPDREGGLVSKMRLAEEGIYDEPSLAQMYSIFDRPLTLRPSRIYKEIIKDHPESKLAPLAQLKLAIWELWNKRYLDGLKASSDFVKNYPESELLPRAVDVGMQSFSAMSKALVAEENYPLIVKLWEKYPFLREHKDQLSPGACMALGLSFWKEGQPGRTLALTEPYLKKPQIPEISEMAMSLALSVYLDNQAWDKVVEVAKDVKNWELTPEHQRELNYAQGLAFENLGKMDKSKSFWKKLAQDKELDPRQRAYAQNFMAQSLYDDRKYKEAYEYAQESLSLLLDTQGNENRIRDDLRILMDVTEKTGRIPETLKWAAEYEKHMKKDDPSYPALKYRVAGLYRKAGDTDRWKNMLKTLAKESSDTLYGRMASSDLELAALEENAQQYQPDAQLQ